MTHTIRKLAGMLAAIYGRKTGRKILLAAWRSLALEEQAAIGLVLQLEEDLEAAIVAAALRQDLAKSLPGAVRRLSKGGKKS